MTRYASAVLAALLGTAALPAQADVPAVVTDIPVVASLVQQVMGDLGQPAMLLDAGADPHHYQLRPSQARSLQQADLLVWVGPELTPWLERATTGMAADSQAVRLIDLPDTHRRNFAAAEPGDGHEHAEEHDHDHGHDHDHDHDHSDEHEHAHEDGHDHEGGHEGHDHSGLDPHAWLDPENGKRWLMSIAAALSQRDPENAATYQANADTAAASIDALDAELQAMLAPAAGKHFAVFHDAYGYFTSHYGLEPAIAVSLGDASAPSAARLSEIRDQIRAKDVICAFPERNHDPKLLAAVTEGSTLREGAALDPSGSAATPSAGLYAEVLRGMATALSDCLNQG